MSPAPISLPRLCPQRRDFHIKMSYTHNDYTGRPKLDVGSKDQPNDNAFCYHNFQY